MPSRCSACSRLARNLEAPYSKGRMCCGCCCFWCGSMCLIMGLAVVGSTLMMFVDNTHDLMFIDNTNDDTYSGPFGEAVSEKKQFETWKKPMKQSFQECAKEHPPDSCINGIDVTIGLFNVTNAEAIVHFGALPHLQELGPVYLKQYVDKKDIDTNYWDQTGVAKFREEATFELDEARCNQACKSLLEAKIIVPNPVWAQFNAMDAEFVIAAIVTVGGMAMQQKDPAVEFGLSKEAATDSSLSEAASFSQIFLSEQDQDAKLASIGLFLHTAVAAATMAEQGDSSATCQLGSLQLPAMRCSSVLQKLQAAIAVSWPAAMQTYSMAYGTGAAAPVFIQITVQQALGFDGSTFKDPLMSIDGLSFAAAHNHKPPQSDPPGLYKHVQMSSKFGKEGAAYSTKYLDAPYDCRFDVDCKLQGPSFDSCVPSDTCTPSSMRGYMTTGFPGRLWGNSKGFEDLKVGQTFTGFQRGRASELTVVQENEYFVESKHMEYIMVNELRPKGMVHYFELTMTSFNPRLENCDGKGPGSPGVDCTSPLYAVNLAPAGAPLYVTNPYFDNRWMMGRRDVHGTWRQVDSHKKAVDIAPYDPASRVVIIRCTNNSWCDDPLYGRYNSSILVEPESGLVFKFHVRAQMNVRIAAKKSYLYPKMQDALVPVYWISEGVEPTERLLEGIYDLQQAHQQIEVAMFVFFWYGLCSLSCAGFFGSAIFINEKRHRQQQQLLGNQSA